MAQKLRMCNLDLCFSFYRYFSELLSCTASVKGRHTGIIDRILKALALSHQLTTEKTKSHKHLHSLRSVMIICSCSTTFNLLRLSLPEGLQTSERDTLSFTLLWCARLWTNKPYLRVVYHILSTYINLDLLLCCACRRDVSETLQSNG